MNTRTSYRQTGYMLLEVLVSTVIFAVGVLGVVGMQAIAIKNDGASKYRADASALADQLIGSMWATSRDPNLLIANYHGSDGTGGQAYTAWLNDVNANLPLAAQTPPTVTVATVPGAFPPLSSKSVVTINLFWKLPGEPDIHRYVAVAEIK